MGHYDWLNRDSRYADESGLARQSVGLTYRPLASLSLKIQADRYQEERGRLPAYYGASGGRCVFFPSAMTRLYSIGLALTVLSTLGGAAGPRAAEFVLIVNRSNSIRFIKPVEDKLPVSAQSVALAVGRRGGADRSGAAPGGPPLVLQAGAANHRRAGGRILDRPKSLAAMFRLRAEAKGLAFEVIEEGDCLRYVVASFGRWRSIFWGTP